MLDLDELAAERAKTLSQSPESWRDAVWGPEFQELARHMSDGEVEEVLALCPTALHLRRLASVLSERVRTSGGGSPFNDLQEMAAEAGLSAGEWISTIVSRDAG